MASLGPFIAAGAKHCGHNWVWNRRILFVYSEKTIRAWVKTEIHNWQQWTNRAHLDL